MKRFAALTVLALWVLVLVVLPFSRARADELALQYDGAAHTLTLGYEDLWRLLRAPDVIFLPPDAAAIVSAHNAAGAMWSIAPDGSVYADGVPVAAPAGVGWTTLGADFATVTVAAAATCRYGVPGKYAAVALTPGTYQVLPATFGVADPAVGTRKTLDCQVPGGKAAASQLTLVGLQTFGKFGGSWLRYSGGQWVDASSTPAALLEPAADPTKATH